MTNVLFSATSYPRSRDDWQGIFIKRIADALAERTDLDVRVWAPPGPLHRDLKAATSAGDAGFLRNVTDEGGIAQLLRRSPMRASVTGAELVWRLHRAYRRNDAWADVFHVNWLQCALGLFGTSAPALVTVLGTDLALLENRWVTRAVKQVLRGRRVIVCPNGAWMVQEVARKIGDACEDVICIPFGVDEAWFEIQRRPTPGPRVWITVLRVTKAKIGPLFEWTREVDHQGDEFHLFGPMQEPLEIPSWVHYHGAVTPEVLARDWYPRATGMISLSQHDEGRPQVLLEAMASELPIIASPIAAHADLIDHGSNGLIASTRDEFLAALGSLQENRYALQIAERARQMVKDQYGSWADCANRYLAVYGRLLKSTRK